MIAALAAGEVSDWTQARARFVKVADEVAPDPSWRDRYQRYAEVFDALHESSRPLWNKLDALD
jgi:xylulokinase